MVVWHSGKRIKHKHIKTTDPNARIEIEIKPRRPTIPARLLIPFAPLRDI
jgi:hypothetical protein